MKMRIAVLPGDGIGREIVPQAVAVLDAVASRFGLKFDLKEHLVGGAAIDQVGHPLPEETLAGAKEADAVLLGAVGGPKWETLPYEIRPERALLGLREQLGLFANLRPVRLFPSLAAASTLKPAVVQGTDLVVVRELTGGIYFGRPRGIEKIEGGIERGINTEVYTTPEIERIARVAFELARQRRRSVTSVDKANVLEATELWRRVVARVHREYADVALQHMYVDNCAMQLVRDPKQFDVIVTTNMFGDILSDEAAMLTGSIGMLPSASIGEPKEGAPRRGMYEPIHGSAPDIAGKDLANPLGTILCLAMMLRHSFDLAKEADAVEKAVSVVLAAGYRTRDLHGGRKVIGCREMGKRVAEAVRARRRRS